MRTEIKKSLITSIWFVFLTFPLMVLKTDHVEKTIEWRWYNMVGVAIGAFFISYIWRYFLKRSESSRKANAGSKNSSQTKSIKIIPDALSLSSISQSKPLIALFFLLIAILPWMLPNYQTSIIITTMMYIILGLGLNIVVGMAGLLDLGYVAFYGAGAYTFALLNYNYGFGFWTCLPIAGIIAATMGVLLGIPVLRLRGDYLAIVTLGFGEIFRLVAENWNEVFRGPSGVPNIPKPGFFGIELPNKFEWFLFGLKEFRLNPSNIYLYYITTVFMIITIIIIRRLHISRIGRAWLALREDEVACQAMGIDTTKTKLTAFSLGAFWAGFVGVIFAAKASFINPISFTFFESAIILSIVVLGGMGSIRGVILATIILVLLPEYLRFFKEYRMLTFGAIMVIMMVFRPQGLVSDVHHEYKLLPKKPEEEKQP